MQTLKTLLQGDVCLEEDILEQYATDASPCYQRPLAVVFPAHAGDCSALVDYARLNGLTLTARGAGTSLAGQAIGAGLIVDFSRYMNRVLSVDIEQRTARVQPGLVLADLNASLEESGLYFAPDPSTQDRCTLGGMVGNNSWGIHAPRDGTTRDHIEAIQLLLGSGEVIDCESTDEPERLRRCCRTDHEARIYNGLGHIFQAMADRIVESSPLSRGIPSNDGYALALLAGMQPWCAGGKHFSLTPLVCGAEGTLGLVTEITVRLTPRVVSRSMLVAAFTDFYRALDKVPTLKQQPGVVAIECLDAHVLELARTCHSENDFPWLGGEPAAVLMIELNAGSGDELVILTGKLRALLDQHCGINAVCTVTAGQLDAAWQVRRSGLHMLMEQPYEERAVTGIEDAAVDVQDLAAYVREVHTCLAKYGLDSVNYGPVAMGGLHIRPRLNRTGLENAPQMQELLEELADIVARFGGSLSAKHGDGRLRGGLVSRTQGAAMLPLYRQVKHLFDPYGLFNPLPLG